MCEVGADGHFENGGISATPGGRRAVIRRGRLLAGACLALCLAAAWPSWTLAKTYEFGPLAPPLRTGRAFITVTVVVTVNGKDIPFKKTIVIPEDGVNIGTKANPVWTVGIKPYKPVPCAQDPKETREAWQKRCNELQAKAMAAASRAKAKVMADAINKAFEGPFEALGETATTGTEKGAVTVPGGPKDGVKDMDLGTVKIPGLTGKDKTTFLSEAKMGEAGDGGGKEIEIKPGVTPGGTTHGVIEQKNSFGGSGVATGVDPLGYPSWCEFGQEGGPIAKVYPTPGMKEGEVLEQLATQLNASGLPAIFDPSAVSVSRSWRFPGPRAIWGCTDTGLELSYTEWDP